MRLLICVPVLLAACALDQDNAAIQQVGTIDDRELDEASGLAHSLKHEELLWVINDDGPPTLHAVSQRGESRGQVTIPGAVNQDWEDLAAFAFAGENYIVIADIGDNDARRPYVTLYVVAEPEPDQPQAALAWQVNFSYPKGPRDAESLAVDATGGLFYILSKRDLPARLFTVPLQAGSDAILMAQQVAILDSLPQPSEQQRKNAAKSGWSWQPTAMDFSPDGLSAIVLSYGGVYFFARDDGQTWPDALRSTALEFKLGRLENAEAIAFGHDGLAAFLTVEKWPAPLFRIDLRDAHTWHKNNIANRR